MLSHNVGGRSRFGGITRRQSGREPTGLWCTVGMLSNRMSHAERCRLIQAAKCLTHVDH